MGKSNLIIERIKRVSGVDVEKCDVPSEMPECGVLSDVESDSTVFTVTGGGKTRAFRIAGAGNPERTIAALMREYVNSIFDKLDLNDDPMRAFLDGRGDIPLGVHIGKTNYYVFAIYCDARKKSVGEYISTIAGKNDFAVDMSDGITALCKRAENDNDYRSAGEFAVVLRENIAEEIKEDVKIGVGGVARGASELPLYYGYAKSALVNGAEFDPASDIYSYKEYALIKVFSDLPRATVEKYVKIALDKNYREVLADDELMSAADAFLKHSLNISEASRSMYVHRNTLIYRLDKIERITGLDIRNFNDAMTFRTAYLIYKMM